MIRLAVVSDEISRDFSAAVKLSTEWGIHDLELRYLKSGRIPFVSRDEIDSVIQLKKMYGARISALSPGLFQISLRDEAELKLQLEEKIYETFRLADRLETKRVVIFGFKKYLREPETNYIQIIHSLSRMAALAEKYGFTLLLKNSPNTWADTGENLAKILNDVNSKNLRANWDLANGFISGEIPYPYGYLAVRRHLSAIHVKDVRENKRGNFEYAVIGDGEIDWEGQIRAVVSNQETDFITIETRCQPLLENSCLNVMKLKKMIEKYQLDENYIVK